MRTNNEFIILLYHGVTNHRSIGIENYSRKHVPVEDFQHQMMWLKSNANIISMDDIVESYENHNPLPKNAVAITFDDGFENNYTQAAPILDEHSIPATFYVSSGLMGQGEMFWVDMIEDCINYSKTKQINICLDGDFKTFKIGTFRQKIYALQIIKKVCKLAPHDEIEKVVSNVISETGITPNIEKTPNYALMDWDQLAEMHRNPNFVIGGHSLKHEILSNLDQETTKKNINESIGILNQKLHTKISHYSYPEGQGRQFDYHLINNLVSQGIRCCPSARYGKNSPDISLFNLYRIMVGFNGIIFPYEAIRDGKDLKILPHTSQDFPSFTNVSKHILLNLLRKPSSKLKNAFSNFIIRLRYKLKNFIKN